MGSICSFQTETKPTQDSHIMDQFKNYHQPWSQVIKRAREYRIQNKVTKADFVKNIFYGKFNNIDYIERYINRELEEFHFSGRDDSFAILIPILNEYIDQHPGMDPSTDYLTPENIWVECTEADSEDSMKDIMLGFSGDKNAIGVLYDMKRKTEFPSKSQVKNTVIKFFAKRGCDISNCNISVSYSAYL